jgi:hypothetical protein
VVAAAIIDDALLEELGVEVETKKDASRTPREERIIAGFEEIQRFVDPNQKPPASFANFGCFASWRLSASRSRSGQCGYGISF